MIKKILIALAALFVLGCVVVFFAISSVISSGMKEAVNTFGPEITQTELSVQDVDVSLFGGTSSISGLLLGNPEGFKGEKAMSLENLEVAVDVGSIFDEGPITIKRVYMKAPSFAYEKTLKSSNIAEIQKNIEAFSAAFSLSMEEQAEQGEAPVDAQGEPLAIKVIVEEVIIEGGSVGMTVMGQTVSLPMPSVTLKDIGKAEGGIGPDEALGAIVSSMVNGIGSAVAGAGKSVISGGADGVKSVTGGLKNLIGGGE